MPTTIDDVIDALSTYLQSILPITSVVRGSVNLAPLPAAPCIVLRDVLQVPLETVTTAHDSVNDLMSYAMPTRADIQIDFYGVLAGDYSHAALTTFRTGYAVSQFPDYIKPLYSTDATRAPLVTGEEQYEDRWIMTVSIQYNSDVTVSQDYFDVVGTTECVPADVFYP